MSRKYRSKLQQKAFLNIMNEAKTLYDRKLFTDVTVQCEGEKFPVHQLVLVTNSPYFRDYFWQEKNKASKTLVIDFMKSDVLRIVLHYFYTGRLIIEEEQHTNLLKAVAEASSVLQMPLLSKYCLELLLNKSSYLSLSDWKVIEELDNKVIFDIFLQQIGHTLASINTTPEFLQLSANQLNVLFQCQAIAESDQNIVFQSILNWIKYDSNIRKEYLSKFLQNFVDFDKLHSSTLSKVQYENLLTENSYFRDYILKSYFSLISKEMKVGMKHSSKGKNLENPDKKKVDLQNTSERCTSTETSSIPQDIRNMSNQLMERKLFIYDYKKKYLGGSRICWYNFRNNKINRMIAHPLINVEAAAVIYYQNSIYTFGGSFSGTAKPIIYSYNMETKQWLQKSSMLNITQASAAVKLNNYIYVLGSNDEKRTKFLERYDPSTDQWNNAADLPVVENKVEENSAAISVPSSSNGNPDISSKSNTTFSNQVFFIRGKPVFPFASLPSSGNALPKVTPSSSGNALSVPFVAMDDCLVVLLKLRLYKYIPEDDKWSCLIDVELSKHLSGEVHMFRDINAVFIIEKKAPKAVWIYNLKQNVLLSGIIPSVLKKCDGVMNLENPQIPEFLVTGNSNWFIYRPPYCWIPFNPNALLQFKLSMLTLLPPKNGLQK